MKRDLVELGKELSDKVPFHTVIREFELKGALVDAHAKFRIRVGWHAGAVVEYKPTDDGWILQNWSVVPRGLLQTLTASIKEEGAGLLKNMDEFIEKECEAEIRETITDVICKKGATKSRQDILVDAINSRIAKMSNHFMAFQRPSTFYSFSIRRTFEVPRPPTVPEDDWSKNLTIVIDEDSFRLVRKVEDSEDAMLVLMTMPQIAEFVLKVYTQLAHLAEWEKSQ